MSGVTKAQGEEKKPHNRARQQGNPQLSHTVLVLKGEQQPLGERYQTQNIKEVFFSSPIVIFC